MSVSVLRWLVIAPTHISSRAPDDLLIFLPLPRTILLELLMILNTSLGLAKWLFLSVMCLAKDLLCGDLDSRWGSVLDARGG